jgi:uncharacterized protein (UPF0332 family)
MSAILSLAIPGRTDIGKTHRGTLSAFSEHFVKTGIVSRELGVLLKHAETFRYVADYEGGSVDVKDAQELVQQAQAFVTALRLIVLQK